MTKSENIILERKYYAVKIELTSPLCVSSGEDLNTDEDVLRNREGDVFIPGSSLAGAFREYSGASDNEKEAYGYSEGEKGRMSAVFVSDLYFEGKPAVSVRDRVRLTDGKTVDNKFDMEIIETGAKGMFFLETVRRKKDQFKVDQEIPVIMKGLDSGEIRLGANKNRGFGRCRIISIGMREFSSDDLEKWTEFMPKRKMTEHYEPVKDLKNFINGQDEEKEYIKVRVPLRLKGGISIRKYSSKPGQADYEQITCNGEPVIPGNSWNGAVRADIRHILKSLGCSQKKISEVIWTWFGWTREDVKEKGFDQWRKKNADRLGIDEEKLASEQSLIVLSESIISGGESVLVNRNKVSRFSSAVIDSALYSELSFFGGKTCFEYMIRKDPERNYQALAAVMEMVVQDIQAGIVPVGGLVSIGRGIFEADQEQEIFRSEKTMTEEAGNALYEIIISEAV